MTGIPVSYGGVVSWTRMMFVYFLENDSGAVTVDWVVLTAGLAGLGLAVATLFANSIQEPASAVNSLLQEDVVSSSLAFGD